MFAAPGMETPFGLTLRLRASCDGRQHSEEHKGAAGDSRRAMLLGVEMKEAHP